MHEVALAEGIMDIVRDYAEREQATRVSEIALKIGAMSGVETEALLTAFRVINSGTLAAEAKITIKRVPLCARCASCGYEAQLERYNFWCPACDGGVLEIISGRELQVDYLEME